MSQEHDAQTQPSTIAGGDPYRFDFLVIGSGVAGLHYALRVAEAGEVAIITKREATDSATDWAQGGIAAVMHPDDSFDAHVTDTMNAGAGYLRSRPFDGHQLQPFRIGDPFGDVADAL